MEWAALITWILTAGGGFVMLAIWLGNGGMEQDAPAAGGNPLIRPPLILGHFGLAATGLILWIVYVASDSDALAWIAFVLLLLVALIGFTMLGIWLRQRRAPTPATASTTPPSGPAEQRFPVAIVGAHGVLAATTLVLVFLAAIGVGS